MGCSPFLEAILTLFRLGRKDSLQLLIEPNASRRNFACFSLPAEPPYLYPMILPFASTPIAATRVGSCPRPGECRRSGSPASRGRKDHAPSIPSVAPPTARQNAGRWPISTNQSNNHRDIASTDHNTAKLYLPPTYRSFAVSPCFF
jgi:hypothetical protein